MNSAAEPEVILHVDKVGVSFGGLRAVDDASLQVRRGSISSLIGPNGAGKTTLYNAITGRVKPQSGTILFQGGEITGLGPEAVARRGLVRTFQVPRSFNRLSVMDNMLAATTGHPGESLLGVITRRRRSKRHDCEALSKATTLLDAVGLSHMRTEYAGTLSGGQRKLLELARALMTDPQLVLLDEPMAGVHPSLGADLLRLVRQFRDDRGTTFLLIEHDMNVVMDVSDHVTVMAEGQVISAGTATSVRSDEKVIEAYLGRSSTVVRESSRGARTTEQPSSPPTSSVLRLHKVLAGYHGSRTLHGVSLNVDDGEVVCLIGPNGAGKSTVLKSLMGFAEWQGGDAHFGPRDRQVSVARLPAHQLVRLGVGYVPQVSNVFPDLSVLENIEIGTLGNRALARSVGEVLEQFPVLQPRVRQRAGTLSGGERQLLALARALICRPTLLLLDEPTAALSPLAATKIFETIAQVADSGTSVLLVEQNARQALAISDRAYVLVAGETAYSGPAAQLLGSDELSALYLGGGQSSPDGQDAHG